MRKKRGTREQDRKRKKQAIADAKIVTQLDLEEFEELTEEQDQLSHARSGHKIDIREFTKRRKAVELLITKHYSAAEIAAVCEHEFGMQYTQTQRLIKRVMRKWENTSKLPSSYRKEAAVSRIIAHQERAAADGAHGAVMAAENLLMKINGIEAPKQIEVKVDLGARTQAALSRAFAALTPEQMHKLSLAGQRRRAHMLAMRREQEDVPDAEYEDADE